MDPVSETLTTAKTLMETPDSDIITAAGRSDSNLLNNFREHLVSDIISLDRRSKDLEQNQAMAQLMFNAQVSAISSAYNSLLARLPATSGRWYVDFYTNDYVGGANDAEINTVYGQATLPILSSQEKLVGVDTRGKTWIPLATQVQYSYNATAPNEQDWLLDSNYVFALDTREDTAWWRNRGTSGTVWVRVKVPTNLNANKLANCVILHNFPALRNTLVSVEYRNVVGSWTSIPIDYLNEYLTANSTATLVGNIRLFFPQTQVTELRIKLTTYDYWGFQLISLRQVEFSSNATLSVNLAAYNPGTLTNATLYGKNRTTLSFFNKTITNAAPPSGPIVSYNLVQTAQNQSPVITGLEARN